MQSIHSRHTQNSIELNLVDVLFYLLDYWLWILISMVLGVTFGVIVSKCILTPQYEASVNMIVNTSQDHSMAVTNDNLTSSRNLASTYAILIKSNTVLDKVNEEEQLNLSYSELNEMVDVNAINSTQIMKISVIYSDPEIACRIVEAIARIAPPIVVDAVEAGSCKVVSKVAVSDKPVSPDLTKNVLLSLVLFITIAVGILLIKMVTNKAVISDDDIEKYLDLDVIGVIPDIQTRR